MFGSPKHHDCNDPTRVYNYKTGNCVLCDAFTELKSLYPYDGDLTKKQACINIISEMERQLYGANKGDFFPMISIELPKGVKSKGTIDRLSYFTAKNIHFQSIAEARKYLDRRWRQLWTYLPEETKLIISGKQYGKIDAISGVFQNSISKLETFSDTIASTGAIPRILKLSVTIDGEKADISFIIKKEEQIRKDISVIEELAKNLAEPAPLSFIKEVYLPGFKIVVDESTNRASVSSPDGKSFANEEFTYDEIFLPTEKWRFFVAIANHAKKYKITFIGPSPSPYSEMYVFYQFDHSKILGKLRMANLIVDDSSLGAYFKNNESVIYLTRGVEMDTRTFFFSNHIQLKSLTNYANPGENCVRLNRVVFAFYDDAHKNYIF